MVEETNGCLGVQERSRRFPAVVKARGSADFTGALIGPKVLLTAAHTVDEDDDPLLISHQQSQVACCELHPHYSSDGNDLLGNSADLALCRLTEAASIGGDGRYEAVNLDRGFESDTESLLVTGFGPRSENGPASTDLCIKGGDSGGPAFSEGGIGRSRLIIGVNSEGPPEGNCGEPSKLTSTSSPAIAEWIRAWAEGVAEGQRCGAGEPVAICGVNAGDDTLCRTLS
ncbi:MAG: trypsin-like serine protease [Acidobacteriota bacterium]